MENSEPGANPGRYRHCMRGGAARGESRSLGAILRRQCGVPVMRKPGDLLGSVDVCLLSNYGETGSFHSAEIRLRQSFWAAAVFCLQG